MRVVVRGWPVGGPEGSNIWEVSEKQMRIMGEDGTDI